MSGNLSVPLTERHFCLWLQTEVAASRIDFRSTPDNRHSLPDVGFPLIYVRLSPNTGRNGGVAIRSQLTQAV